MLPFIPALIWALPLISSALGGIIPPPISCEIIEQLDSIPPGWIQGESPPPDTLIHFRLAVVQEKAGLFEQAVIDLATPGNPSYGQYMKRDQVKAFLRPSSHISEAILSWLERENVPKTAVEDHGDWINFIVPALQAEKMLHTQFHYFHSETTDDRIIRTLQYSLPHEVARYVHMIQPTTRFGQPKPNRNTIVSSSLPVPGECNPPVDCNVTVTPACIRKMYNIGDFNAKQDPRNKLGISGYLDQYARYADFALFLRWYAPELEGASFDVVSINGGLNLQNSSLGSGEASLDIDYAIGLSNATSVYYTTAGVGQLIPDLEQPNQTENRNEPYLDQLHFLLDLPDEELPAVLTTSYGENEQSVPEKYTNATCSLFAQLGARGVSVLFASGDSGVGSACQSNDGKNTTRFNPSFPASCPFLTSVGGTHGTDPEYAVSFSGGGFSDRYARPSYQDDAVTLYLEQLGDRWEGLYNPKGRGFPDIAAQSGDFHVVDHGEVTKASGTSASAPVWAAIIANLNSIRLDAGKPVLGFLNPFLYSLQGAGLKDIVDGGSEGCTGINRVTKLPTPIVPYASWNATPGWDPVTGLGTPDFEVLRKLVLAF
ncbi:vesicle formation at the endoplasmic reticulum [Emmonsiellopsis sp. PD_33]|nr:vesicle formation at the endoplasmic reticulum [Emmonsiellopsis sp. PD_33]